MGSVQSDEDAVGYMANTKELAHLDNQSKIKYLVPKDLDYAMGQARSSRGAYTWPFSSSQAAPSAPSAPSHGEFQTRLEKFAKEAAATEVLGGDYRL